MHVKKFFIIGDVFLLGVFSLLPRMTTSLAREATPRVRVKTVIVNVDLLAYRIDHFLRELFGKRFRSALQGILRMEVEGICSYILDKFRCLS